jgi:glycine hydroxymethyltransferase
MWQVAKWITEVLEHHEDKATLDRVRGGVGELCRQFPAPAEAGSGEAAPVAG